jgi:hypothetical protein
MNAISIGTQVIMPKTGTTPQSAPQQQANDREAADTQAEAKQAPPPPRAPAPPGMGQFVDLVV